MPRLYLASSAPLSPTTSFNHLWNPAEITAALQERSLILTKEPRPTQQFALRLYLTDKPGTIDSDQNILHWEATWDQLANAMVDTLAHTRLYLEEVSRHVQAGIALNYNRPEASVGVTGKPLTSSNNLQILAQARQQLDMVLGDSPTAQLFYDVAAGQLISFDEWALHCFTHRQNLSLDIISTACATYGPA